MEMSDLRAVVTTASRMEAEILAGLLESAGLTCMVDADDGGGTLPQFGFTRFIRVLVAGSDVAKAEEVLAQARANGAVMPDEPEVGSGL